MAWSRLVEGWTAWTSGGPGGPGCPKHGLRESRVLAVGFGVVQVVRAGGDPEERAGERARGGRDVAAR